MRSAGLDLVNLSLYDANKDALAEVLPIASRKLYCKLCRVIGQDDLVVGMRAEAMALGLPALGTPVGVVKDFACQPANASPTLSGANEDHLTRASVRSQFCRHRVC